MTVGLGAGNNADGTRHMDGEHMGCCGLDAALERPWVSVLALHVPPPRCLSSTGVSLLNNTQCRTASVEQAFFRLPC
jgi:hypothetical protein